MVGTGYGGYLDVETCKREHASEIASGTLPIPYSSPQNTSVQRSTGITELRSHRAPESWREMYSASFGVAQPMQNNGQEPGVAGMVAEKGMDTGIREGTCEGTFEGAREGAREGTREGTRVGTDQAPLPLPISERLQRLGPASRWIVLHDQSIPFALGYVGLTILLSVFVSYFWLLALVGLHLLLEWFKKGYLGYVPGWHRFTWTVWDTKFDIALIFLALTLLSYTGIGAGVAGAQSLTRMGLLGGRFPLLTSRLLPVLARFSRVGMVLRGLGIRAVDLFFSARVILFRKADMARSRRQEAFLQSIAAQEAPPVAASFAPPAALAETGRIPEHYPWQRALGGYGWFAVLLVIVNSLAVLLAPVLTEHSYASLLQTLATKFHPWP
jgi:hypothetical protein